jgi:hypothetical protein
MSPFGAIARRCAFGVALPILFVIILTSASAQGDTVTMEANTDRMGGDYRRIDASPSVEACHSACVADKECDAYTYVKSAHHCWLKKGVPGPAPNNDTVSGVKKRAVGGGSCATVDGMTCEPNTDRMGADYRRIDAAPSVQFCQNQCATDPKCAAYTYVKSAFHCWLKTSAPNVASNSDTLSGVKLRGPAPATAPEKESVNSKTYLDPKINGRYVDNCLNWGSNCQKPAADYFCRQNGFSGAISFELAKRRPTWVMGDNKVCNEDICVGFSRIVCGGETAITPADRNGSDESRTKINQPGNESVIFYNGNEAGVSPGGKNPPFSIDRPVRITYIFTYHYGYTGAPGNIRIMNVDGAEIGIWQARVRSGSPKPSYYWEITPNVELQPGTYLIETSSRGSWSQNAGSGGNGMVQIKGVY